MAVAIARMVAMRLNIGPHAHRKARDVPLQRHYCFLAQPQNDAHLPCAVLLNACRTNISGITIDFPRFRPTLVVRVVWEEERRNILKRGTVLLIEDSPKDQQ